MLGLVERWTPYRIAFAWVLVVSILFCGLRVAELHGVVGPDFDVYWFDNVLYNTVHGHPFVVAPNHYTIPTTYEKINHFSHHNQPILLLFIPIYAISPSVFTITILQVSGLGLAAIPLYRFAMSYVSARTATVVVIAYLINPIVFWNAKSFHPVAFLPLVGFSLLYFYRVDSPGWFLTCLVLALSLKETTPIFLAPLALYLAYDASHLAPPTHPSDHLQKYVAPLFVGSVLWFFLSFDVVIPHFSSVGYTFTSRYAYLGNSLSEILRTLMFEPATWLPHVLSLRIFEYVFALTATTGFIAIRSSAVLTAAPYVLLNVLSTTGQTELIRQYQIPVVVALYLALVKALAVYEGESAQHATARLWLLVAAACSYIVVTTLYFHRHLAAFGF